MTLQQYTVNNSLTSVDLVSTANISATYRNGPLNNGVGATLSLPSFVITIDSITVTEGMNLLLKDQTNTNENGIYICIQTGVIDGTVLERRADFHCIEQMNPGQYLTVSNGVDNIGELYVLIEPLPNIFGIDEISFVAAAEKDFSISLATSFPGNVVGISSTIIDSFTVNQVNASLEAIKGIISLNGILNAGDINCLSAQFFAGSGSYVAPGANVSGVKALMDFGSVTDVSSTRDIVGLKSVFQDLHNVSNNTGLHGIASYSLGTVSSNIFSHYRAAGKADYLISLGGDSTDYYLTAGTSAGSAGDTTKCNATRVIRIFDGTINGYIPIFLQNS